MVKCVREHHLIVCVVELIVSVSVLDDPAIGVCARASHVCGLTTILRLLKVE
jgi:hypothetical protein